MTQVADAFVRYLADTKDLAKAVGPGGPVDQAGDAGATKVGQRFTAAFAKTTTAAGAVGGALFVGAVGGATKFEDQLRTINTVAHLTDGELSGVGKSILDLSKETGKGTDDLTAGFYDLVSAGIPADKAINVLRDSAKFATGALGTTGEAVDVVTSALNAYGMSADQSGKVTDIFAQAVADGKVTAAELGASLSQIAPIASSAGISLEEVSTGFAVLTAKGVPAAQAATQMRAAISALLTPNSTLNDLTEKTGINFAKMAKEKGLAKTLDAIRVATGGNDEMFAKALGSTEAYQFALAATGDGADAFATELGKVTKASDEGGVAQGQYEEKMKSAASQGAKLTAGIHALGIEIGGPFVDSVGPAVSALGGMGTGLSGIFNISKLLGGGLGAIGGKLIGILIPAIAGVIPAAATAAGGIGTAIAAAIPLGAIALPALLLAAVVAAVLFLVANPQIVAQIAAFVGSVLSSIATFLGALPGLLATIFGNAFAAVVAAAPGFLLAVATEILKLPFRILDLQVKLLEFFAGIWTNILGGVAQLIANVVGFFVKLPGRIAGMGPAVLLLFATLGQNITTTVTGFLASVVGFFLALPGQVAALVPGVMALIATLGSRMLTAISTTITGVVNFFLAIPGRIASVGGRIVGAIIGGMASLPGQLAGAIAGAFRAIRVDVGPFHISGGGITIDLPHIDLPSFAVGSNFIPADMLAMVHRGEIIIPADEAAAIRTGRATLGTTIAGSGIRNVSIGDIYISGVGSDVSPAAARRFGADVMDAVAAGLREQTSRGYGS